MRQKQKNPKKTCLGKRTYDEKSLVLAYEAVKDQGWTIRTAANSFGVPVQTLRDRISGRVNPYSFKLGHSTTLLHEEEETLVSRAEVMAQLGYGFSNRQFQHLAGELMYDLGRKGERKMPSNNWLYSFLKRWNHRLTSLSPRKLDTARAKSTTPEAVDSYFTNLEQLITQYNMNQKPHLIFNTDEIGLQPDHRPPNVIATPGSKPQAITSPRSSTVTLIGCANALGNSLPPFFVFKGKRFNDELLNGATTGTRTVMSGSGWSNSLIFISPTTSFPTLEMGVQRQTRYL